MKLQFPNGKIIDLSMTKVMGSIVITENDERSLEDFVTQAKSFVRMGAEFLEVGAMAYPHGIDETKVNSVFGAVINEVDVPVAIHSDDPEIIKQAINTGATMLITTDGLDDPEVQSLVKDKGIYVCIMLSRNESHDDEDDAISRVSEFFFEKIDSYMNAGLARSRIILDPTIALASLPVRLKVFGGLDNFKSFALPLCISLPRNLPQSDEFVEENRTLTLTAALFAANSSLVQIIRSTNVSEVAMAVGLWQLMSLKNKPYGISKAIIRRFRGLRDKVKNITSRH